MTCQTTNLKEKTMYPLETVTAFLGWCTVINFGILIAAALAIVAMRGAIGNIHSSMFKLGETELSSAYFQYLANYKILVIVFNLVPYLALRIIS
jgi:hypothetical protein